MNPDLEMELAEVYALTATMAVANALCRLLPLVEPIVERRGKDDVRFGLLVQQVRLARQQGAGTPETLRALLTELGGGR